MEVDFDKFLSEDNKRLRKIVRKLRRENRKLKEKLNNAKFNSSTDNHDSEYWKNFEGMGN